jgi:hypothetical protein
LPELRLGSLKERNKLKKKRLLAQSIRQHGRLHALAQINTRPLSRLLSLAFSLLPALSLPVSDGHPTITQTHVHAAERSSHSLTRHIIKSFHASKITGWSLRIACRYKGAFPKLGRTDTFQKPAVWIGTRTNAVKSEISQHTGGPAGDRRHGPLSGRRGPVALPACRRRGGGCLCRLAASCAPGTHTLPLIETGQTPAVSDC